MWWQIYLAIHAVLGLLAFGMYRNFLRQFFMRERQEAGKWVAWTGRPVCRRYDGWDVVACIVVFALGPLGLLIAWTASNGFRKGIFFSGMPEEFR